MRELDRIGAAAKPNEQILVILIGHGSFDGRQAAFNLPGPDLTADDYKTLLAKFPTQKIVFVNTASSSGKLAVQMTDAPVTVTVD